MGVSGRDMDEASGGGSSASAAAASTATATAGPQHRARSEAVRDDVEMESGALEVVGRNESGNQGRAGGGGELEGDRGAVQRPSDDGARGRQAVPVPRPPSCGRGPGC